MGALISAEEAIEVGYEIGRTLRDNGVGKSREVLHMKAWSREHQASPYIDSWRKGFVAGYRSQPKPAAPE